MPGESTNWLPPYRVHASTNTTMAGGACPPANTASAASGKGTRKADRLRHMATFAE